MCLSTSLQIPGDHIGQTVQSCLLEKHVEGDVDFESAVDEDAKLGSQHGPHLSLIQKLVSIQISLRQKDEIGNLLRDDGANGIMGKGLSERSVGILHERLDGRGWVHVRHFGSHLVVVGDRR